MNTSNTPHPVNKVAVLAIILVSYLMTVLDISIVITALPKIEQDMHFTTAELTWVQSLYTLTFGGFLLMGARAGDIFGRRRMLSSAWRCLWPSSLVIGLSPSARWMLSARAIAGRGFGDLLSNPTLALMSTYFAEGQERTRAVRSTTVQRLESARA